MCAAPEESRAPVNADVVGGAAEGDAAVLVLGVGAMRRTAAVGGVEGGDGAGVADAGGEDGGVVGGEGESAGAQGEEEEEWGGEVHCWIGVLGSWRWSR